MRSSGPSTEDQGNDQMKRYPQILTSRWCLFFRRRQQRADSPGPSNRMNEINIKTTYSRLYRFNVKGSMAFKRPHLLNQFEFIFGGEGIC